jgi:PPOX class probable F420-dependent enzyme
MQADEAREFIATHHRAVLATRRADGETQMSPVVCAVDDDGRVLVSTRETAMKTRHLRRDPRAALCVFTDGFFGPWVQVEGRAEVISLPGAMDSLIDYYRRVSGEHPDWADYRAAMVRDRRVIVKLSIDRAGPNASG